MKGRSKLLKKSTIHLALILVISTLILSGCEKFSSISKPEDNYGSKEAGGSIILPGGASFSTSECEVLSPYGEAEIKGNSFTIDVEKEDVQQMIYMTNESGSILMLNFMSSKTEDIVMNTENTAISLILLFLEAAGTTATEWDKLINAIKSDDFFPDLRDKVETMIKNETDIFSEENTDMYLLCGELIDNMTGNNSVSNKSKGINDLSPLEVSVSETSLNITNNGFAPLYQVTVTKDGEQVDQKNIPASDPLTLSIGSIFTGGPGAFSAPDPVNFRLNKQGEYQFHASSGNLKEGFSKPASENVLAITNNILLVTGFPIKAECAKAIADIMYNSVIGSVLSIRNVGTNPWNGLKVVVDYMLGRAVDIANTIAECDGKPPGKMGKYMKVLMKSLKGMLKFVDVTAKVEAGTNAAFMLAFWASQPSEITFCRMNDNNLIRSCGSVTFDRVFGNIRHVDGTAFILSSHYDARVFNETYEEANFSIGRDFVPDEVSFSDTGFKLSGAVEFNSDGSSSIEKNEVEGTISSGIITSIQFSHFRESNTSGGNYDKDTSFLKLHNLHISLNGFDEDGTLYFKISNPTNIIDQIYKYHEVLMPGLMDQQNELTGIYPNVLSNGGYIEMYFFTAEK